MPFAFLGQPLGRAEGGNRPCGNVGTTPSAGCTAFCMKHSKHASLGVVIAIVILSIRVHSSVVRAADCRSAGPWFKSGCALLRVSACAPCQPSFTERMWHTHHALIPPHRPLNSQRQEPRTKTKPGLTAEPHRGTRAIATRSYGEALLTCATFRTTSHRGRPPQRS